MIVLGRIEARQRLELGDDRRGEDMRLLQLRDIGIGEPLLLVVGIEDRRAVLKDRCPVPDSSARSGYVRPKNRSAKSCRAKSAADRKSRRRIRRVRSVPCRPSGNGPFPSPRRNSRKPPASRLWCARKPPCTPQKQPPAKTTVCKPPPADAGWSSAGGGIATAGSAAWLVRQAEERDQQQRANNGRQQKAPASADFSPTYRLPWVPPASVSHHSLAHVRRMARARQSQSPIRLRTLRSRRRVLAAPP